MDIQIQYKLCPTSLKWPVSYIFKGCFIKYVLSNNVRLLLQTYGIMLQ